MREEEIAWAAGLFEGEGTIFLAVIKSHGKEYRYPRLNLKTTDLDVLEEFQRVVGVGSIYTCSIPKQKHWKQAWYWQAGKYEESKQVFELLSPFLFKRRKEQWASVVERYTQST